MGTLVLFQDHRPDYVAAGGGHSLLTMPAGRRSVLEHLLAEVAPLRPQTVCAAASTRERAAQRRLTRLAGGRCHVCGPRELGALISAAEPSDWVVLIDARWRPRGGLRLKGLLSGSGMPRVQTAVALPLDLEDATELVQVAADGGVQRIRRYYDGITWPQRGEIAALAAPGALLHAGLDLSGPAALRAGLIEAGAMVGSVMICPESFDLCRPAGLLGWNEALLRQPGRGRRLPRAMRGRDAAEASTRRGPIYIAPGAQVARDATLVGPVVVGPRACIGPGATVCRSVVAADAIVPPGTTLWDRVCVGRCAAGPQRWPDDESIGSEPALRLRAQARAQRRRYEVVKRGVDALAAGAALTGLAPLLLAIAALIKLTSRGPVFFAHEREGRNGVPFRCLKFRTMVDGAHERQRDLYRANAVDGPQFKLDDDPRATPVGRWLRRTNLDELPQLINVLRGEMSLVGPRPSPFRENQICVSWRRARLSVRPGITGLWQVCRSERHRGDFYQWIHYDTLYVRHFSPWLDFKILLATFLSLGGRWTVPLSWILPEAQQRQEAGWDPAALPGAPSA